MKTLGIVLNVITRPEIISIQFISVEKMEAAGKK